MSAESLAALAPGFRTFVIVAGAATLAGVALLLASRRGSPAARRRGALVGRYLLLTVLAVIVLFPIYITVVDSLLQPDQVVAKPPILFPRHPQWSSYSTAWNQGHLGRYLLNSFIVTTAIVVGELVTSIAAAYAFAFLEFPFRRTLFVVFLATMMVPVEVTFLTNLSTVVSLGWYNSYLGLTVPFLATGFGAFLLRQSFLGLPKDLRDASRLDGAGHWRFLRAVVLPVSRPAVAALAIFSFFAAFGQYLWPLIVTKDDRLRTVQIGLKFLANSQLNNFNVVFAGTVLAALPLFILLILFEKQLVRGLTAGAVKG